jgi:anti-sigma B factor antagonist
VAASFADTPTSDLVRVHVAELGPAVHVVVSGEVDSSTAPVLERSLTEVLSGCPDEFVVDLCAVTFLDSAGLCVLAAAHRQGSAQGTRMRLLVATRAVARPLQITGLWGLLGAEPVAEGDQSVA